MHKLLQRQLKRCAAGSFPTPEEWATFLKVVNEAYEQNDADRALLERSLELSSQELIQINESLRNEISLQKTLELKTLISGKMAAIGQLASGVAHEINNPLGVILGFAQGALRRIKPGDLLEKPLQSIERESIRCRNLVQDLLTFSRAAKMEREPMNLNQAVEGALSLVTAKAKLEHVKVHVELQPDLPKMLGNPNQIQQVIINLATNALDVMEKGGAFTVKTSLASEVPTTWVCLRVSDTGSGIPADVLPRIFEPFFTTKPVGQGTGLGLALIHEIVSKHSGTIDVQSRPGFTEFTIRFPVRPIIK